MPASLVTRVPPIVASAEIIVATPLALVNSTLLKVLPLINWPPVPVKRTVPVPTEKVPEVIKSPMTSSLLARIKIVPVLVA